jgi:electron transfer flavoprotein beta subunit
MPSIIVCIKQVPDTQKALFDPKTGVIKRDCAENIMNPDDYHAIEMALEIRDAFGGQITVLTMGPDHAADVLAEAYAYGVDRCVLLSDRCFAGSDSLATSRIISRAISGLGGFDIILTGREAIDGNTGHVSYQVSEFLGIPLITQIHKFEITGGHAVIERLYGHEYQTIRVRMPLLLSVGKNANRVRAPRLVDMKTCFNRPIETVTAQDIGGTGNQYGASGSPTVVIDTEIFSHARHKETLSGTLNEKVDGIIHTMKKLNVLRY